MDGRKDSDFLCFLKRKYSNKPSWSSQQQVSGRFVPLARNWVVLLIIIFVCEAPSATPKDVLWQAQSPPALAGPPAPSFCLLLVFVFVGPFIA